MTHRRGLRLAVLRETARTRLWPVPVAGVVLAVLAGLVLPELDARLDDHLPGPLADAVFGGGAGAARTVLDAVASSLITVTSLTFSLTVVTLQLASSQFSPRLLRTFTQDRFVHTTLAVFLATFTYALTVLRTVRSPSDDASGLASAAVVPRVSVTVAFLLAVASVVCLVLFLAHLAREIRVETMLARVQAEACRTADLLYPSDGTVEATPPEVEVVVPAVAVPLAAARSGFLCFVDEEALLEVTTATGLTVVVDRHPGTSVVAGTPVAWCWSATGGEPPREGLDRVREVVADAVVVGPEPTQAQVLRLVVRRPGVPALLDLAVAQPARYGAADPVLLTRVAALLGEVAWCTGRPPVLHAVGA
ncbi:DUF2254 domain-containing protein [Kineococcus sp. NPDC059986]|uniref:DUF2254 domain-containing protein n=1 Tax=Kineococcus sp. NPDC059986 TaxID=3155538 RepID=UPI00344BFBCB